MQNSQTAAIATALGAVALGVILAIPSSAASPSASSPVNTPAVAPAGAVVTPAVAALKCGTAVIRTDVTKHFGTSALNGNSTFGASPWKALEGYLAETGSTAKAAASDFNLVQTTADRVVFTKVGTVTSAVMVDRASASLWDWHQGANCA